VILVSTPHVFVLQIMDGFISFRRLRGLIVFFPYLKLLMAHSATVDWRERSFVENCFACARSSSRYFASTLS
jgi:hypothetical protein